MRVNARLDIEHSNRLKQLQSLTHEKVTEIIRHSIDLYYQKIASERALAPRKLLKSRLIGCAETDALLSENYKSILSSDLIYKYDHR